MKPVQTVKAQIFIKANTKKTAQNFLAGSVKNVDIGGEPTRLHNEKITKIKLKSLK